MKLPSGHSRLVFPLVVALTAVSSSTVATSDVDGVPPDSAHDCLIEPRVLTDVGSPTQGIVARVLVDRGAAVMRGQVIVELESSIERAALDQADARAEMQSEVVTREADLALAQLDSRRFEDLHERRLAPTQQRDEAVAREQVASAALVQALEGRLQQQLELERARRTLEQRTIRSPIDGVVVEPLVDPGELVYDNPVMRVAKLDPLRVEVVLPGRLFGTIRPGDAARVFPEFEHDGTLTARVDVVDPLIDTRSGTFGVRLLLPNAELAVPAGQKCRVSLVSDERDDPFLPASGREDDGGRRTGTATLGAAEPRPSGPASDR